MPALESELELTVSLCVCPADDVCAEADQQQEGTRAAAGHG